MDMDNDVGPASPRNPERIKLYVASSWRNRYQPQVVSIARQFDYEVYDFRQPAPGNNGFRWSEVAIPGTDWQQWTLDEYRAALNHPTAQNGFALDMEALIEADACLLVMPCGRSAHLELGYAVGARKPTAVLYPEAVDSDGAPTLFEPELMVKMTTGGVLVGYTELRAWLYLVGTHLKRVDKLVDSMR